MLWLPLLIVAYAMTACLSIADKYFLVRAIPRPSVYAFYVGILGLVFVILAPFALQAATASVILAALASGSLFTLGVFALFRVLAIGDTSRVIPVFGSFLPIFTLGLAWLLVGEELSRGELAAFAVLVLSSIVLSVSKSPAERVGGLHVFFGGALAALLLAASSVFAKYVFLIHPFLSGFIWTRIGGGLFSLLFFLWPGFLGGLWESRRAAPAHTDFWVVATRIFAGISFLMIHYAISLTSVTLVNALKGVEYAMVFLLTLLVSRYQPGIIKEEVNARLITLKSVGVCGIIAGLALLV